MAKTALITGCSSGIGRATAEAFREDHWTVWATARNADDLAAFEGSDGYRTAELDVTDDEACERVVASALRTDGAIDCLVNNAGYGLFGAMEDVQPERLADQFDVNVLGAHRLVREVAPHMRERRHGTIVNVSSVSGRIATPASGAYAASKHALEAMSDALRGELGGYGVDVVVVEPGPVATNFDARATDELAAVHEDSAYGWLYEVYDDLALLGGGESVEIPPRAVALTIRDAANATDPGPRYPVGQFASWALKARHLPEGWRDRVLSMLRTLT